MARPPRLQVADGIYHVTARGNERRAIYRDANDRRQFVALLARARERFRWRLFAYCLMENHYHLLVQTPDANLVDGMHWLNGVYAQRFNRRHTRVGHLFQGRYGARLVQAEEHLRATIRYIVRNPVRAGLCRDASDWPWSSHAEALKGATSPVLDVTALLSHYAPEEDAARRRYEEHVAQTEGPAATHPLVAGDDEFIARALAGIRPAQGISGRYLRRPRPPLSTLLGTCADNAALQRAREYRYTLDEIARHLGVDASTVSRRLRRGYSGTARSEP